MMCSEPILKHQKESDYLICKVNKLMIKVAFHVATKELVDKKPEISYLDVFVAIGTNQCNVFSISSLISATVSCVTQRATTKKEQKNQETNLRFSAVGCVKLRAEEN